VLGGWSLSGVTTIQSGLPFSVTDSRAGNIFGASSYAQFAPGKSASDAKLSGRTQDRLNRYFNTSVFGLPPAIGNGFGFGNSGRSILRGPGQTNFDMALRKSFKVGGMNENGKLEFRSEFFNILNHAQFGLPGNAVTNASSFGVISSTVVSPRIIQFALKYSF
ncbi:MAG: TonB-dependent receptor plug, partial [Acidobacteria bacterium]|nr:TonB-dependent receptor plug [Acidobacteriota bacterium]